MKPTPDLTRISAAFLRGFQFALLLVFLTLSTLSSAQSFLCSGTQFTTANIITTSLTGCTGPYTYEITSSNVTGVPVTPASQTAATTYTPTSSGTFTVEITGTNNQVCTTQTFNVIGLTGTQAACSDYDFSVAPAVAGLTYTYTFDGVAYPNVDVNGAVNDFDFMFGGSHSVMLTISSGNNSCSITQTVSVGGPDPQLSFTGNNFPLSTQGGANDTLVVPFCLGLFAPNFNLGYSEVVNTNTTGTNISWELNNTALASGWPATSAVYPTSTSGYVDYEYTITDNDGCSSTVLYSVFLFPPGIAPNLNAQDNSQFIFCLGDNVQIDLTPGTGADLDYTLIISCDAPGIASRPVEILAEYNWFDAVPPSITWTPNASSCGCDNDVYWVTTYANHPCDNTPNNYDGSSSFQVGTSNLSSFTATDTLPCVNENVTFTWNNSVITATDYCQAAFNWSIIDPSGNTIIPTFAQGQGTPILNYAFTGSGDYSVCLDLNTLCDPAPQTQCMNICVTPNATASVTWNIPATFCANTPALQPVLTIPGPSCVTPTVLWTLTTQTGAAVPAANYTLTGATTLTPTLQVFQKGLYRLNVAISNSLCLSPPPISSFNFTVAGAPIVTSSSPNAPCPGTTLCIDDFICVNDCYSAINAFNVSVYAGTFANCTVGAAVPLWSSTTLPSGSIINGCLLSNPYCANQYAGFTLPATNNAPYTVVITATNSCGTDTDCFTFNAGSTQTPTVNLPNTVCAGSTLNLTSDPLYQWGTLTYLVNYGTGYVSVPANGQVLINNNVTFQITSGAAACGAPLVEPVAIYATPQVTIDYTGTQICAGQPLAIASAFTTGPINSYQWYLNGSPTVTTPNYAIANPTDGSTIGLTVTYGTNCSQSISTVTIDTYSIPIVLSPNCFNSSICQDAGLQNIPIVSGAGIVVTALTLDGGSILGSTTIDPSTLSVGLHTVVYTYTANGCTYTSQCTFTITAPQTVTIVNPSNSPCTSQPIAFTISPNVTTALTWSCNPCPSCINAATGLFTPTTAGTYTITVDGTCINQATLNVTVGGLPTATITSPNVLCASQTMTLAASTTPANATTSWYVDLATDIPTTTNFNPQALGLTAGNYSVCVNVVDPSGCDDDVCYTVNVTNPIAPAPTLSCDPAFSFFCENSPVTSVPTVNPLPANWTFIQSTLNGAPYSITDVTPGVAPFEVGGSATDDTFIFEFEDVNGCPLSLNCDVNVQPNYSPTITYNGDLTLCPNQNIDLNLSSATSTYGAWSATGGALINPITGLFSASTPGQYTASFTGLCIDSVGVIITVVAPPTGDVTMPAVMCVSQSVPLSGTTNDPTNSMSWYISTLPPTVLSANLEPSVSGISAGNYNICMSIQDTQGCTATVCEPIQINNAAPAPVLNCNPAFTHMCDDMPCESLPTITLNTWTLLDTLVNNLPFTGNQICAGTAPFVISGTPHSLTYSFVDPSGCPTSLSCPISVFDNYTPTITANNDFVICETETITFATSIATGGYGAWSMTGVGSLAANGVYTVPDVTTTETVSINFGGVCVDETTINLDINPNPIIAADPVTQLCINETLTLTGSLSADVTSSHWEWNGNALTGNIIDPDALGMIPGSTYQICLVANNAFPCEVSSCFNLQIIGLPAQVVLDPDGWHCQSTPFTVPSNNIVTYTVEFTHTATGAVTGPFNELDVINFTASGNYDYLITIESTSGCVITQNGSLNVIDDVAVDFSISNYSVCSPSFTVANSSTGMQATYAWSTNLPGGLTTSNAYAPVPSAFVIDENTYGDQTYFITLNGQNVCSSGTETIEVNFVDVPEIFINASVESACSEFNSTFLVTCPTTTDISSINYSFNNGWPSVSATNLAAFTQTFTSTFYQEVIITADVCNQCGCDSESITVEVYPPDTEAEFEAPTFLCPGESGIMTNLAVGPDNMVTSWSIVPSNGSLQIANNNGEFTLAAVASAVPGNYTITQTTSSPGCGQSVDSQVVTIGSLPDLDFTYDAGDVCSGSQLCFQNQSSNFGALYWNFGTDNVLINDINPCYIYESSGYYDVTISSTSPDGCDASYTETVQILGPDATISHADSSLCMPGLITFQIPSGEYASLEWNIQLPDTALTILGTNPVDIQFNSTISSPYLSTISVTVTDIFGCTSVQETEVYLKPGVTAAFDFIIPEDCTLPISIPMNNLSTDGVFSRWLYNGVEYYLDEPTITITENNSQVTLYVVNEAGCEDVAFQSINCEAEIYVPNSFTPDDDGINDYFSAKGEVFEFEMWIFDRWGEAVFHSKDINEKWIGNYRGGTYYVPDGVYNWKVEYKGFGGEKKIIMGHVTIVR